MTQAPQLDGSPGAAAAGIALAVAVASLAGCDADPADRAGTGEPPPAPPGGPAAGVSGSPTASVDPVEEALDTLPAPVRKALPPPVLETVTGEATFYADVFEGRTTASGTTFRQSELVAAHRAFPFGTVLRVTNLRNDRQVQVRVVDRGPFGARAEARNTIIDLSRSAAEALGFVRAGRVAVRVDVVEWGDGRRGSG